jgi:putative sigma-54 modulation protein
MSIQITGDNIEVTPALRENLIKKFKHLDKYQELITAIHVTLSKDHLDQVVEAQINIPKNTIHAKATSHDMYHAIDDLVDKLSKQLYKHKEKLSAHH